MSSDSESVITFRMKNFVFSFLIAVFSLVFSFCPPLFSENSSASAAGDQKEPVPVEISPQDFLKTKAAQYLTNKKYNEALVELEQLEKQYPNSVLIKRYLGFVLAKFGRHDQAVAVYQSGLEIAPENIPLRYFLAQTLVEKKDFENAAREFKYVKNHDETGAYGERAKENLRTIQKIEGMKQSRKPRKWSLYASGGAEYNTNATLESRVPEFRVQAHQSAWRFFNTAGGSYEFFKKGAWSARANYNYSHSFYSDSLSQLNTIFNSPGASITRISTIAGKPFIVQLANATTHIIVRENYYATAIANIITAIYMPKPWWRVSLSDRLTFTSYAHDEIYPDILSRDGFSHSPGVTHQFYFNEEKTLYTLVGFDYQRDDTQGSNYVRNGFAGRFGFHFPICLKAEGDLNFRFRESLYPKFGYPYWEPRRRDEEYYFTATVSRPLTPSWTLNGSYNLTMTESRNDRYTYTNDGLGFSLSYAY